MRSTAGALKQKHPALLRKEVLVHGENFRNRQNWRSVTTLLTNIHVTASPGFHNLRSEPVTDDRNEQVATRQACPLRGPPCRVHTNLRAGSNNCRLCCLSHAFVAWLKQQQLETQKKPLSEAFACEDLQVIYVPSCVDCHQHSASALPATVKKSSNEYSALAARVNKWLRKLRVELQVFGTQLSRVRLTLIEVFDAKSVSGRVMVCVCAQVIHFE